MSSPYPWVWAAPNAEEGANAIMGAELETGEGVGAWAGARAEVRTKARPGASRGVGLEAGADAVAGAGVPPRTHKSTIHIELSDRGTWEATITFWLPTPTHPKVPTVSPSTMQPANSSFSYGQTRPQRFFSLNQSDPSIQEEPQQPAPERQEDSWSPLHNQSQSHPESETPWSRAAFSRQRGDRGLNSLAGSARELPPSYEEAIKLY